MSFKANVICGFLFVGSTSGWSQVREISQSQYAAEGLEQGRIERLYFDNTDIEVTLPDGKKSYLNRLRASFQTQTQESLTDYVFVNFIRGCHFTSKKQPDGTIQKYVTKVRNFFGQDVPYIHPNWVIDSVDLDPVYFSGQKNRHEQYRWNQVANSFDQKTEHLFSQGSPVDHRLYVTDRPGVATYLPATKEAFNISLQLRMCLYRERDVPKTISPDVIDFATPIYCYDWASSWIYDFNTGDFKQDVNSIDDYCLKN